MDPPLPRRDREYRLIHWRSCFSCSGCRRSRGCRCRIRSFCTCGGRGICCGFRSGCCGLCCGFRRCFSRFSRFRRFSRRYIFPCRLRSRCRHCKRKIRTAPVYFPGGNGTECCCQYKKQSRYCAVFFSACMLLFVPNAVMFPDTKHRRSSSQLVSI